MFDQNKRIFFVLMTRTKLVNKTCIIALVQAGMQENQFASAIVRAGNIKNFNKNCADKSLFFSQDSKVTWS